MAMVVRWNLRGAHKISPSRCHVRNDMVDAYLPTYLTYLYLRYTCNKKVLDHFG